MTGDLPGSIFWSALWLDERRFPNNICIFYRWFRKPGYRRLDESMMLHRARSLPIRRQAAVEFNYKTSECRIEADVNRSMDNKTDKAENIPLPCLAVLS